MSPAGAPDVGVAPGPRARRRVLALARRLGILRLLPGIPEREMDGLAYMIAYIVAGKLWLLRRWKAPWPIIHRAWARSLDAGAGSAGLSGTLDPADDLRLLIDAKEAFTERLRLFAQATTSLDVASYYIQSDEIGWTTARALADCAARGVRVRLLVDRHMTNRKRLDVDGLDDLFAFMERAGVQARVWHDPARPYDSNHRKMILVDGATAVVGGRNFAVHYHDGSWRDVDILMTGPTAARLVPLFESIWRFAGQEPDPLGNGGTSEQAPWFNHVPARVRDDPTMRYVLACLRAARRTVDVELAYFVGPAVLRRALVETVRRGVRVRLLTNSAETNDLPIMNYAMYASLDAVLKGGVQVFVRRGAGRTLHSKYVIVDGAWVSFGSHNLDYYSSRFCCETNLHVRSERLAALLLGYFEEGLADASPLDREGEVRPFLAGHRALRFFDRLFRDFQ